MRRNRARGAQDISSSGRACIQAADCLTVDLPARASQNYIDRIEVSLDEEPASDALLGIPELDIAKRRGIECIDAVG